jgi:hypothetical protein
MQIRYMLGAYNNYLKILQLIYGRSLVKYRFPHVPEIRHGEAPRGISSPVSLKNHYICPYPVGSSKIYLYQKTAYFVYTAVCTSVSTI